MTPQNNITYTPAQKLEEIDPAKVKDDWLVAITDPESKLSFKLDRPNFKKTYGLENTISKKTFMTANDEVSTDKEEGEIALEKDLALPKKGTYKITIAAQIQSEINTVERKVTLEINGITDDDCTMIDYQGGVGANVDPSVRSPVSTFKYRFFDESGPINFKLIIATGTNGKVMKIFYRIVALEFICDEDITN